MARRRVVISGLGIVSPVGSQVDLAWQNVTAGMSGIKAIDTFDTTAFTTKFAGLVDGFVVGDYMSSKEARKIDPFIQYGIAAATQAVEDSGIPASKVNLERVGVNIGSGIGGITTIQNTGELYSQHGPRKISPFFIPGTIINMIAGHVSIKYGFQGPNLAVATACTTSTHSIGLAYRTIQYGEADIMVAGGAERASTPLGVGGFAAARALSTRNDNPAQASRPWDIERDGFVIGDGASCLVLEEYEHAKQRGAPIYAEVIGYAMNGDAYHITRPAPEAAGAMRAMQLALQDASLDPVAVDYINAHATSTPVGDLEECRAIQSIFQNNTNLVVSSTKSMTGHLLGAAGAIEALFTVLALHKSVVPPTINLETPEPECTLDLVPHTAREKNINIAISNSFGFGGTNGTLIFKRFS